LLAACYTACVLGEPLEAYIFMGPVYYQKLKHVWLFANLTPATVLMAADSTTWRHACCSKPSLAQKPRLSDRSTALPCLLEHTL
jgi:hypothetical protein